MIYKIKAFNPTINFEIKLFNKKLINSVRFMKLIAM